MLAALSCQDGLILAMHHMQARRDSSSDVASNLPVQGVRADRPGPASGQADSKTKGCHAPAGCSLQRATRLQVRNLQERLEEEHQALLAREVEVAGLHGRVSRLTQLIIRAVRSHTLEGKDSLERRHLLRAYWRPAPVPDQSEVGAAPHRPWSSDVVWPAAHGLVRHLQQPCQGGQDGLCKAVAQRSSTARWRMWESPTCRESSLSACGWQW